MSPPFPLRLLMLALCLLSAGAAWAHDEGPPEFPCDEGPFGLPGPALPPDQIGAWDPPQPLPTMGTHALLLGSGKVLFFKQSVRGHFLWDPETGQSESKPLGTSADLFCAGHATLADGRAIVVGGGGGNKRNAIPDAYLFDPQGEAWTRVADMALPRWYPTETILADGRVLSSGGVYESEGVIVDPTFHEAYDPATDTWTPVLNLPFSLGTYPPMFTLEDGTILQLGIGTAHNILDVENDAWTPAPSGIFGGRRNGTAAMLRPGKILKVGGDGIGTDGFATALSEVLDLGDETPAWRLAEPMEYPRRRPDLVLLPTGEALVVGGSVDGQNSPECGVHAIELFDPDAETWTTVAPMANPRIYHSTALLLPDGRVVAAGGENSHTDGDKTLEIYSPPYLFKGPRPEVTAAPDAIGYGAVFQVDTPDTIASVSLMRPGSVTHNYDQNQRFLSLDFNPAGDGIAVAAPATPQLAPPGPYMLFLLSDAGVPSVAHWITISSACNDGVDNDLDGAVDRADVGCADAAGASESPQCSDGINNDPGQDAGIDFDGGLAALGYVAAEPDPQCIDKPAQDREHTGCGIGVELAVILPALMWLRRRRRRTALG